MLHIAMCGVALCSALHTRTLRCHAPIAPWVQHPHRTHPHPHRACLQLVLIYNNTIYWPSRPDGPKLTWPTGHWASPYKCDMHAALAPALAAGRITLPNALFIYNTDDNIVRFGKRARNLTVPSLSISRLSGGPELQPEGEDLDILVPQVRAGCGSAAGVFRCDVIGHCGDGSKGAWRSPWWQGRTRRGIRHVRFTRSCTGALHTTWQE